MSSISDCARNGYNLSLRRIHKLFITLIIINLYSGNIIIIFIRKNKKKVFSLMIVRSD